MLKKPTKKYFHTIRFRILLCTIALIVFISAIITFISYFVVSNNLRTNLFQTSETRLSFLCSSIDSNIDSVKSFIKSCKNNSQIRKFVMMGASANNKMKREAKDFISETYTANAALPSQIVRLVIIGNPKGDILQIVESPYSIQGISAEGIYSLSYYPTLYANLEEISTGILQDPFITAKKVPMLPYLHAIQHPYKAGEIGYIFTEMSLSVIIKPIQNYFSETDSRIILQIGEKQYLYKDSSLISYTPRYQQTEDLSYMALNRDTIIKKVVEGDNTFILFTRPLKEKGLYMTECLNEHYLRKEIYHTFLIILLVIGISAAFIGILLSWFLDRTINVPVKMLQKRMLRIAQGDFSKDPDTEWEHELGDIGKNINELSENVLSLMNQKLEHERQKKDYEYKMLQSQINPHFLYNTLNSIKWMATIQNAPGIAEMTTSLSRLLKDISKGTTTIIPLEHELSLIKDYFTIQQYRYGGTITLDINIEEEELVHCKIVKFTLQPIVENAIFHGIEPKGSAGTITIHVYQPDKNNVRIDVTDNGVGMSLDIAHGLLDNNSPAESSFFKEIGISNVHKRLQYEFGDAYGLSIYSELGQYTTVSILLPFEYI